MPRKATLVILLVTMLALGAANAGADPYEPNNSTLEAAGPLVANQGYTADLSPGEDRDFYFLHVTSRAAATVELSVANTGGGALGSDIDVAILDASATPLSAQAFIREGETRTVQATLDPGKYYVEVASNGNSGDTYLLSPGGGDGAFGPYAQIAARCAQASDRLAAAKAGLREAEGRLQRAVARRRRSRYAGPEAHKHARLAQARARSQVNSARRKLRVATSSLTPWCSIPQ